MNRLIPVPLLIALASMWSTGALALQDDPLCGLDPATCCVVDNPDFDPFDPLGEPNQTYLARDCCGEDNDLSGALDEAVACCTDPNDPFSVPMACGCTDPLTGAPVACDATGEEPVDCDLDPVSCFVPGEADDPTDPPDSSGEWPFGSDIKLFFTDESLQSLVDADFEGTKPAGLDAISPQVAVNCFVDDPLNPGQKRRLATCPCDGTPGLDLEIAGTAVSLIEGGQGLLGETAACATVLLAFQDVTSDSAGGQCVYSRAVSSDGSASQVVEPSIVRILESCPEEVIVDPGEEAQSQASEEPLPAPVIEGCNAFSPEGGATLDPVKVEVFAGITESNKCGGTPTGNPRECTGSPYSDLQQTFFSPDIQFLTDFDEEWFPLSPQQTNFGARFTGLLEVDAQVSAQYTFELVSDDGSQLFIDGSLVIDNGGVHAPRSVSGAVELTPGTHSFEIEFYQGPLTQSGVDLNLPDGVAFAAPEASCSFPVGLEDFQSDGEVAAALPESGFLLEGEVLLIDEVNGLIETRLCSGTPDGPDPESIACTDEANGEPVSRAGGTRSNVGLVSCTGDWLADDDGVATQVINPSGKNDHKFAIVSNGALCDADPILEVLEGAADPAKQSVFLNGVEAVPGSCHAVAGTSGMNLVCKFDEAAVYANACAGVSEDKEVRTLTATGFTQGAAGPIPLVATDEVRCKHNKGKHNKGKHNKGKKK